MFQLFQTHQRRLLVRLKDEGWCIRWVKGINTRITKWKQNIRTLSKQQICFIVSIDAATLKRENELSRNIMPRFQRQVNENREKYNCTTLVPRGWRITKRWYVKNYILTLWHRSLFYFQNVMKFLFCFVHAIVLNSVIGYVGRNFVYGDV